MTDRDDIGERIRSLREGKELSLSELARQAGLSKGYLWQIEAGDAERPSGQTLYKIASVLGTSIAHLLGHAPTEPSAEAHISDSLRQFQESGVVDLDEEEVRMLSRIRFRGKQPQTPEDWRFLYESIKRAIE